MRTASTNKKVREIIRAVSENKLVPRPEFQRRLVWTHRDKNHFLDSIIRGYPFPEIYLADGDIDLETGKGTQLLVDGLQRVSTMVQYFEADPELKLISVPSYKDLSEDQKQDFLQYDVAVRDLGRVSMEEVIEVFQRINATKYSLKDIEINNAVYSGALKQFADEIALEPFFYEHRVFNATDYKRMGDLRFALSIVITLLGGYFNRDDEFEEYLGRYNEDFDESEEIRARVNKSLDFIDECGFESNSRAWRKADLFTLIVEIVLAQNISNLTLEPSVVLHNLESFYAEVSKGLGGGLPGIYYKAALQASNDRLNRIRRGEIIAGIVKSESRDVILTRLQEQGLV